MYKMIGLVLDLCNNLWYICDILYLLCFNNDLLIFFMFDIMFDFKMYFMILLCCNMIKLLVLCFIKEKFGFYIYC